MQQTKGPKKKAFILTASWACSFTWYTIIPVLHAERQATSSTVGINLYTECLPPNCFHTNYISLKGQNKKGKGRSNMFLTNPISCGLQNVCDVSVIQAEKQCRGTYTESIQYEERLNRSGLFSLQKKMRRDMGVYKMKDD